ncbi:MAG: hypothetical protein PHV30_03315 [Candidatus Margulisbacteria bacterium]|nr:hypothetical protein [Candidatus Margulisiibacteriota bacterium]
MIISVYSYLIDLFCQAKTGGRTNRLVYFFVSVNNLKKNNFSTLNNLGLSEQLEFQKTLGYIKKHLNTDKQKILEIIDNFRLNANQSYEFVQLLYELQLQKNKNFKFALLENFEPKSSKRSEEFMRYLRKLRYPQYMDLKEKLEQSLKKINSSTLKASYKDNFESNCLDLCISLKNPADIDKICLELKKKKAEIENLLEIIGEGV